jgi:hypothetical protein
VCASDVFALALVAELSNHWEVTELVVFHQTRSKKGYVSDASSTNGIKQRNLISRSTYPNIYVHGEELLGDVLIHLIANLDWKT